MNKLDLEEGVSMKRLIALALLVMVLTMVFAIPASAGTGPCSGDSSGKHYGQHHISDQAKEGIIGGGNSGGTHVPGGHQGFSLCDPSG